jgi:SAM-dependent methyltransferase
MKQDDASNMRKLMMVTIEATKKMGIHKYISPRAGPFLNQMNHLWYNYYKKTRSKGTFVFQGKTYGYFWHECCTTGINERAVEIPITWEIVKEHQGKNVLEVGNVLSHYFSVDHDVVDKYEVRDNVINQDVVDFQPSKKYDLIVSISTLEHVGWDETPRESKKVLRAIENLKKCLTVKGRIAFTLPMGYNPDLDRLLREGKIPFTRRHCLKRISRDNKWIEVDWEMIRDAKYGYPFHCANGLVVGVIEGE